MAYPRIPREDSGRILNLSPEIAPEGIEFEGDLPSLLGQLPESGLAIVGTRSPQSRSLEFLKMIVQDLENSGLIIISGFARGIDARAHELALEYGLKTIAILGCGLDIQYPREHQTLRERILSAGGAILSPFPPGTPPYAGNFLERNGLIAGFARAVWVVEAAERSGTLNTATWAMRLHRHLYATPCFPGDPFFSGNQKLLAHTHPERLPIAEPLFTTESLASTWGALTQNSPGVSKKPPEDPIERRVQALISEFGSCQSRTFLERSLAEGDDLKKALRSLEIGIASGNLIQLPDGSLTLRPR